MWCESLHLKQKSPQNPRNPFQLLYILQNVPPSLRTSNERRFTMAAFLPHPVLIFDSGKMVHQSQWQLFFFIAAADHWQCQTVQLSSASLGALQPSSAGFMSVQTSSASAMHMRTSMGVLWASSFSSALRNQCMTVSKWRQVTSGAKSSTVVKWGVEGTSYDGDKGTKPESDAMGVYMKLTHPERTGIRLCWNRISKCRLCADQDEKRE